MSNSTTLRAVAYYRMSSDKQEASIPQQREWARTACARERVEVLAEFADQGIPGSDIEQRPELQRMLVYCRDQARAGRPVERLVCWDLERFSRASSVRTAALLDELMGSGLRYILTQEGWLDLGNDLDLALLHLRQDFTRAAYGRALARNATRGQLERARQGKWPSGKPPYGYATDAAGRLVVGNAEHADTVRWIFNRCLEARSVAEIARELRGQNVPGPKGKPWTRATVYGVLVNPVYAGDLVWARRSAAKYYRASQAGITALDHTAREAWRRMNGKQNCQTVDNPDGAVVLPDNHPPLVEKATFDAVQRRLSEKARPGRHGTQSPWLLTGVLHCGTCGEKMWGTLPGKGRVKGDGPEVRGYCCSRTRRFGLAAGCTYASERERRLLDEIVGLMQEKLLDPDFLAYMRGAVAEELAQGTEDMGRRRAALLSRAERLDAQIDGARARLLKVSDDLLAEAEQALRAVKEEREAIRAELAALDQSGTAAVAPQDVQETLDGLKTLGDLLTTIDEREARQLLATYVRKATVYFALPPVKKKCRPPKKPQLSRLEVELSPDFLILLGVP